MSGNRRHDASGQLALLDAIVFFIIASVISSTTVSYVGAGMREAVAGDCGTPASSPEEMLGVLLDASLGVQVAVLFEPPVQLSGYESIAECLSAESAGLIAGYPAAAFVALNAAIAGVMYALAGPFYNAYLVVQDISSQQPEILFALPHQPYVSETQYAGSTSIPGHGGALLLVVLVLQPSSDLRIP